MRAILAAAVLLAALACTSAQTNKIVCYYGSWAVYRPGQGSFDVEQIDPNLCTHLIYTFVGVGDDGTVTVLDPWNDLEDDYGRGAFKRFNKLRERNPNVKTSIAIGGWNEGGDGFSHVVASDNLRAKFVQNIVAFIQKFGFDGFDIDWEYPGNEDRGGRPEDLPNFSKLIRELHEAFQPHEYILSAAVAGAEVAFSQYYEVPELSKYLDFINVMTYDLHGSWDGAVGQNAPLSPTEDDPDAGLDVEACIRAWIDNGADPSKIIMGMGTYGRTFTLADPSDHEIGAPINGDGQPGPLTEEAGMWGYNEIVDMISSGKLAEHWDDVQQVPFAYKADQWVGYDNEKSVALKVRCEFAKKMNLGGVMIWSIDTDDFQGHSGTKFALLQTINKSLGRNVPQQNEIVDKTNSVFQ